MNRHIRFRWVLFAGLLGAALLFRCLPGYGFSSMFLTGLAVLVPVSSLLSRQEKPLWKGVQRMLIALLVLLFSAMAVTLGFLWRAGQGTPEPQSRCAVVLGAKVNGTEPSRSLQERIDAAFDYLVSHPDAIAVVTGGKGSDERISEAECMFRSLTEKGIAPDRILLEDQAVNTVQNLRFSLELLEKATGSRPETIALITSEYHLCRADLFARSLGLEAELIPAATGRFALRCNYYLREIFALWYYSIFGGFHHV